MGISLADIVRSLQGTQAQRQPAEVDDLVYRTNAQGQMVDARGNVLPQPRIQTLPSTGQEPGVIEPLAQPKVAGGVAPAPEKAPVGAEGMAGGGARPQGQGSFDIGSVISQLYPDKDWEAEAESILARRGLTRPTAPSPFKMTPWMALAALGPALGAVFGGSPGMAAQGALAPLAGFKAGHDELRSEYDAKNAAYAKAAGDLADKMEGRSEKRAQTLLPYLTMTAQERARHNIDIARLGIDEAKLSLEEKDLALRAQRVALEREQQEFDRLYKRKQLEIEMFKHMNPSAAQQAQLELDTKRAMWQREHQAATVAVDRGQLNEAIRHNKNMEGIARSRAASGGSGGGGVEGMKQEVLRAYMEAVRTGSRLSPQLTQGMEILFPGYGKATDDDKMAIDLYMKTTQKGYRGDPAQTESIRQRAAQAFRKMGYPEPPAGTSGEGGVLNFFKKAWEFVF